MFSSMARNVEKMTTEWPEMAAIAAGIVDALTDALDAMSALQQSHPEVQADQLQTQYGQQVAQALLQAQAQLQSVTVQAANGLAQKRRNDKRIQIARPAGPGRIIKSVTD